MKKLLLIILAVLMLSGCGAEDKIEKFVQVCMDSKGMPTVHDNNIFPYFPSVLLKCEPLKEQNL